MRAPRQGLQIDEHGLDREAGGPDPHPRVVGRGAAILPAHADPNPADALHTLTPAAEEFRMPTIASLLDEFALIGPLRGADEPAADARAAV